MRIIFGTADCYLNAGMTPDSATQFPLSETFIVEDAAHYVQLDRPGHVAKLILAAPID